jgi:hypothetical protein
MSEENKNIIIKNVRLSFPALFQPTAFTPGDTPKYSASFLLDKVANAADIKRIQAEVQRVIAEKWGTKKPANLKSCLHEGSEKEYDGYDEDIMFISSSNNKKPVLVDKNPKIALEDEDARLFAGCYVNASISLWAQDNKWGKRINANIAAVQYNRAGEPFGEGAVNAETTFDNIEEEEDGNDLF